MQINFNSVLIVASTLILLRAALTIQKEIRHMSTDVNKALQSVSDKEDVLGQKIDGITAEFGVIQTDFQTLVDDIAKIQPGTPVDPTLLQAIQDKADVLGTKLDTVGTSLASVDTSIVTEDAAIRPRSTATAPVTFSPASGTPPQTVALASATPGASIFYTLDGSTPVNNVSGSTLQYSSPLALDTDPTTITALATSPGLADSAVSSAVYSATVTASRTGLPTGPQTVPGIAGTVSPATANALRNKTGLTT